MATFARREMYPGKCCWATLPRQILPCLNAPLAATKKGSLILQLQRRTRWRRPLHDSPYTYNNMRREACFLSRIPDTWGGGAPTNRRTHACTNDVPLECQVRKHMRKVWNWRNRFAGRERRATKRWNIAPVHQWRNCLTDVTALKVIKVECYLQSWKWNVMRSERANGACDNDLLW